MCFWLLKEPDQVLSFFSDPKRQAKIMDAMFTHIYLSHCVTDLLVRLCTVPEVLPALTDKYQELRSAILQWCINEMDSKDEFITE